MLSLKDLAGVVHGNSLSCGDKYEIISQRLNTSENRGRIKLFPRKVSTERKRRFDEPHQPSILTLSTSFDSICGLEATVGEEFCNNGSISIKSVHIRKIQNGRVITRIQLSTQVNTSWHWLQRTKVIQSNLSFFNLIVHQRTIHYFCLQT